MSELPEPGSIEILRAWLIEDALHCSLSADVFEDPATWGAVLADLARHVASALHEAEGRDPVATLRAISEAWTRELAGPEEDA